MKELHYQLDLLNAINQKLMTKERMYRNICDTVSNAFLYYTFDKDEVFTLGNWNSFFDFEIIEKKDLSKLFDIIDDEYALAFRDAFFIEKQGKRSANIDCLIKNSKKWMHFSIQIICDQFGNPTDKIVIIDNITKFKTQNEELTYLAYYDNLTGLYNRNYFVSQLGNLIERAKKENNIISIMVIDIDDFRKVNDGIGIIIGDELVQQFGLFLKDFCDENIIVSHFNSDLYCMAIYNPTGKRSVDYIHKCIQQRLKHPFRLSGGQDIQFTVSVGVAEFPEASENALELINCAEIVMFNGKSLGKNRIQYFTAPILDAFLNTVDIENRLKEAVFNNNFEIYFQPQFTAGNKTLRGCEALIRWRDDKGHMISPSVFIPIAEKNGIIISIGNWVVEQSIMQYLEWKKKYGVDFIMSINISAMQYKREDFVPNLLDVIKKYNINPSNLELEITESILIDDFNNVYEKLKILKNFGVRISLDDFGTGFSSLSYLKKFPIDTLKIDKTFIDTVLSDSATRIITESIINMAKALGFETIAEGVEQEQQYKYLHAIGCSTIQGYLLGKPMPPEQFAKEVF